MDNMVNCDRMISGSEPEGLKIRGIQYWFSALSFVHRFQQILNIFQWCNVLWMMIYLHMMSFHNFMLINIILKICPSLLLTLLFKDALFIPRPIPNYWPAAKYVPSLNAWYVFYTLMRSENHHSLFFDILHNPYVFFGIVVIKGSIWAFKEYLICCPLTGNKVLCLCNFAVRQYCFFIDATQTTWSSIKQSEARKGWRRCGEK